MKELLKKFENKEPEIIFNWKDEGKDIAHSGAMAKL